MTEDERKLIKKLSKCDFSNIHKYFVEKSEEKKNMTKEEKQVCVCGGGVYKNFVVGILFMNVT